MEKSDNKQDRQGKCIELDTPTQKCINIERNKYCDLLYTTAGEVKKAETSFDGKEGILKCKKSLYLWTEENYRIHRNFNFKIGTELVQSNENVKTNVEDYCKWSDELKKTLKELSTEVKAVKSLFSELRVQACKLEECKNDSCNKTQWMVLTGEHDESSSKDKKQPKTEHKHPKACENVKEIFEDLVCMPSKGLVFDIDSIFKSSADVVGIQVFSNPASLKPIQKELSDHSLELEKKIQEAVTAREEGLKKLQEAVITAAKEVTQANADRFNRRSDFEGIKDAVEFMCCPQCGCVKDNCKCEPRLDDCEEKICKICEDVVKEGFCKDEDKKPQEDSEQGEQVKQEAS